MGVFAYTASGSTGDPRHGVIVADTPRQVRDRLRAQGLSVLTVQEQAERQNSGLFTRYIHRHGSAKVTTLLQELSTLLGAGIPILDALDTIVRQHVGRFKLTVLLIRDHVAAGGSLANALSIHPDLFDALALSIVEVGENSGSLDHALLRLVEYRKKSATLKNRVLGALLYPSIVLFAGVCVSIFLMTYVVPNILTVLLESGKPLPKITLIVKTISDALVGGWWMMLIGALMLVGGVGAILRSQKGKAAWHRLQLRIPLLGELIRKQSIARIAMVMATLLRSGLTFVKALQIARKAVKNMVIEQSLVDCEQAVLAGHDIAPALEKTGAFPPLVIQVFAVGQASGKLETMLENLSADYDAQVETLSTRLATLLEPIMIILLAFVVGFIAFATILPILEAGNVL